jgi:GMP synthase-like glutamine amidotransferase
MRPVAIFRFSATEGPGHFGEWLDAHRVPQRLIALDQGESVPAVPLAFSGIAMMGGPMSANHNLPWSAPLIDLLRRAVDADVPVIGHCLGGQLLAKALGARVTRTPTPEIGWGEVRVLRTPDAGAWFGARYSFTTFQWHYEIFGLPPGATRVLTNAFNPDQAFVFGKNIGFQCHIEMTRPMVETWCTTGADELPQSTAGAKQSKPEIFVDLDRRLAALARVADDVYAQWARGLVV